MSNLFETKLHWNCLAGILVLLVLPFFAVKAQPKKDSLLSDCPTGLETSIWYMGTHGIDWRSGSPVADSGFYSALGIGEGHSSICDHDGNLLFYTDNDYLYNRNHQIMKNSPRFRNRSSVMCAIAPLPGNDSIYYFFSPDQYPKPAGPPYKLRYSIINMKGDNDLGEVITTPAILIDSSSEQVLLARHCNGRDWWVLCQNVVNEKFYAYLIDTGGLNINFPVVSISGNTHNMDWPLTKRGALHLNHSQELLIECTLNTGQGPDFLEIHEFDPTSGRVFNGFSVFDEKFDTLGRRSLYISALSADDSKLYITGSDTVDAIFQFDISEFDSTTIRQSYKRIIHELGYQLGGPILGRDDRIYLTTFSANNKNLHLIHEPNESGDACRLERNGFHLGGRSGLGIPNLANALERPYRAVVQGPRRICRDSLAWYRLREACPHTTEWFLPDGGTLTSHLADSICISFPDTGRYRLIAAYPMRCGYKSDTLQIKVSRCHCDHVFEWTVADTLACAGSTAVFEFKTNASSISYNGLILDSSQFLINHPDSLIRLELSYPLGCDTSLQIAVKWLYALRLDTTILLCPNDSIQIEGSYYKAGQMLRLDRKSSYGCDSIIQIQILNKRSDYAEIKLEICALDSIQISSPSGSFWVSQSDSFEIQWMNAESCDSIIHYKIIKLPDHNISQIHYKCLEDSFKLSNQWIFADTTITEFRNSQTGCDSNITWTIINYPASPHFLIKYNRCEGDSLLLEGNWFYQDTLIQKLYKNNLGCDSVIRHQVLFLPSSPSVQINHKLCRGDSLLISNDWYFTDTNVIFRFQNQKGCDSLILQKVLFGNPPASSDIQYDLCPGQSIQILGVEFSKDTVFNKIYLTEYGCDSIIQYRLRIHPIDTLQLINEVVIDQGTKYILKPILPDKYISIEWAPTEGLSCIQCPEPEITVIDDQEYYLKVTDENGCIQVDSILIRVNKKEEEFWFPMAFSPNGDHINDLWEPISSHSGSKITRISIYDRWGARIFESRNEIKAWDGTINAQPALPGVYIYLVEWIDKNGSQRLSKGEFTLIR